MSEEDEYDKLFNLDVLLGELDDLEADIRGKKRAKKEADKSVDDELPESAKFDNLDEHELGVMEESVEKDIASQEGGDTPPVETGFDLGDLDDEDCEDCVIKAKKFIEDNFCNLTDDEEKEEKCIIEAMALVRQVRAGKITMRQFEKDVIGLGKKYIPDWEDEDEKEEVIPSEIKEELRGDD